ncbi:MAG TPA: TIGR02530 family flagellar biosynthesis protein [Virgibacillus sp.]|nr:TIGR02530 family flagellar biosynthesis protein [Virgibacillus sp.]
MKQHIHQLQHPTIYPTSSTKLTPKTSSKTSFKDILAHVQPLKVSKHAKQRLVERNINISDKQWQKISHKVKEAKQKGVINSVVITNDATLLVSAKNNTVVTAMNREEATDKIFTNINGTILLND